MYRAELLAIIHEYVESIVHRLERKRYIQEPAYVDAFFAKLDDVVDLGLNNGFIEFKSTIVADRGKGSAEHKYGADFALVYKSANINSSVTKAIIGQAKHANADNLGAKEKNVLIGQCEKMARITNAFIVFEVPVNDYQIPTIRIGNCLNKKWKEEIIPFDEYLVDQVIACHHGDIRQDFIRAIGDSKLTQLKVDTKGLILEPDPPKSNFTRKMK